MNQKITFVFHLDGVSLIDDGSTIRRALTLSDGNLLVSSFIAFYGDKDEEPSDQTVRCARSRGALQISEGQTMVVTVKVRDLMKARAETISKKSASQQWMPVKKTMANRVSQPEKEKNYEKFSKRSDNCDGKHSKKT